MPAPSHNIPEERIALARKRFVIDGLPRVQVAQEFDIDLFVLNRIAHEQFWEDRRAAVQEAVIEVLAQDPMAQHEALSCKLLRELEVLCDKLSSAEHERIDGKELRNKIECIRSLSEATNSIIKVHREARGLKVGTPSVATQVEEQGVVYEVVIPPANAVTRSGTG